MNVPSDAGETCPSCGAAMAADQRYCLTCGHRRGDPRLPFMDAVVFMDAMKRGGQEPQQPPPKKEDRRPLMSANASLVAGVATLVLAIGVGVLIGRSGEGSSSNAAAQPQVIKVGGGGGGEEESTASATGTGNEKAETKKSGAKKKAKPKGDAKVQEEAEAKNEAGDSGASKASEEVLEPTEGVKLPESTAKPGDSCEEGTSGCEGGEFNGNFFE